MRLIRSSLAVCGAMVMAGLGWTASPGLAGETVILSNESYLRSCVTDVTVLDAATGWVGSSAACSPLTPRPSPASTMG